MTKIVVDPVTRIEGHLRIEAVIEDGKIKDAWSSSTMWRGIENILKGRDPREVVAAALVEPDDPLVRRVREHDGDAALAEAVDAPLQAELVLAV